MLWQGALHGMDVWLLYGKLGTLVLNSRYEASLMKLSPPHWTWMLFSFAIVAGCREPVAHQKLIDSTHVHTAPLAAPSPVPLFHRVQCEDVLSGDTLVLAVDGQRYTVALACIDCPEPGQPYFAEAKQTTADLCLGQEITCVYGQRNSDGLMQICVMRPVSLEHLLLRSGLAWHDPRQERDGLVDAHLVAKSKQLGLWSDAHPIPPWFWRAGIRTPEEIPQASEELNLPTTASWEQ